MEIRDATTPDDVACAIRIDRAVTGSAERADYIASVAAKGGLSVAALRGATLAFCCLDHGYFFGKPFVSLLIVSPGARRRGLGSGLLARCSSRSAEVWTSTNRSNRAMRGLLKTAGWRFCGELDGLDDGDPERFYRNA